MWECEASSISFELVQSRLFPASLPPPQGALIDVPENILRLPSFLRTTTAEREGLAAPSLCAAPPNRCSAPCTADL